VRHLKLKDELYIMIRKTKISLSNFKNKKEKININLRDKNKVFKSYLIY